MSDNVISTTSKLPLREMHLCYSDATPVMQKSLATIACCLALSACSPCDREKGKDSTSPNHQLTATVIYTGCGAIAKDSTWVTLHRTGEKYDRSDGIVFTAVQQYPLEIAWTDDSHLSVYCRCRDEDVRFQVTKKGGVSISYK
jgi:hypothetical protein